MFKTNAENHDYDNTRNALNFEYPQANNTMTKDLYIKLHACRREK